MAAVLILRLALAVSPVVVRLVISENTSAGDRQLDFADHVWDWLWDPDANVEEASSGLSEFYGYSVLVSDHNEPFELILAQFHITRDSGAPAGTDDAIFTMHFLPLTADAPREISMPDDGTAIQVAMAAVWTALKTKYPATMKMQGMKLYRSGPDVLPPQPPIFTWTYGVAGTNGDQVIPPPQVALSVTNKTSDPGSWGRFYLPVGSWSAFSSGNGRFTQAVIDDVGNAFAFFQNSLVTAGLHPVVYSKAKPVRQTAAERRAGTLPGSLPAVGARALAIAQTQIDDIPDVIRRRRWNEPLIRDLNTTSP